jgi:CO/xanthine dehydrogenase Mo-binding subunit
VTVFTGKVELGQGITTALAQIAADELDIDLRPHRGDLGRHVAHAE